MSAIETICSSVEEVLTPVERALTARHSSRWPASRVADQLQEAIESLQDAADDTWVECGRTLVQLLNLVACVGSGPDGLSEGPTEEILDFVQTSVPQLRHSLVGNLENSAQVLPDLVAQARSRWGEYLTLLDGDTFAEFAELDTLVAENGVVYGDDAAPPPSAEQVNLILSAVRELELASQSEQQQPDPIEETPASESNGMFREEQRQTPPPVPPRPQAIQLSDVLRGAYLEDAGQCLSSMERSVIAFENHEGGELPRQQLCRDLHTLKGASASIGLSELATYLHQLEEWLQSSGPGAETHGLQPILDCVDFVRRQIDAFQYREPSSVAKDGASETSSAPPHGITSVPANLDHAGEASEETVRVRSSQLDRMMNLLVDLVVWRRRRDQRVVELNNAGDELSRCLRRLDAFSKALSFQRSGASLTVRTGQFGSEDDSRESSKQLDEVANDLREIVLSLRGCRQTLVEENRAVSQFIQQFRQQLAQARRVPLSGLFQRLQRVVREAARLEKKQVRLECLGQNTGLERSLQERLYEPLLHLVRNGVCHGIESPEQRQRAGKHPVGRITLEASGNSQMLLLEIRDDGAGLNFDAIRRRGIERGLLRPDEPATQHELSRLIFHPGFSTRTEANEVAGRGVGMDVVLTALNRCHCQIDVHSQAGLGTTFRLSIPLPSVIEHSLIFRCGGQLFGLPMQFVMSTSLGDGDADSALVERSGDRLNLAQLLQLENNGNAVMSRSLVLENALHSRPAVSQHTGAAAVFSDRRILAVEDILGHEEVVVRPLPPLLRRHPVLSGVTLSGSGEVVLLLDGPRLLRAAAETASRPELTIAPEAESPLAKDTTRRPRILVAEDSLSARRRLVDKLAPQGFEVVEVSDGEEALDSMRTETFDAVFSDLEMPGLNGFDLLQAIKKDERFPNKPVVIVTSRDETETRARAQELGADGFLSKPVNDAAIESVLKRLNLLSPVIS